MGAEFGKGDVMAMGLAGIEGVTARLTVFMGGASFHWTSDLTRAAGGGGGPREKPLPSIGAGGAGTNDCDAA